MFTILLVCTGLWTNVRMYIPLDVYRSVYLLQVYTSIIKSFKTLFSKIHMVNLLYEIGTLVKNKNCKEKVFKQ